MLGFAFAGPSVCKSFVEMYGTITDPFVNFDGRRLATPRFSEFRSLACKGSNTVYLRM